MSKILFSLIVQLNVYKMLKKKLEYKFLKYDTEKMRNNDFFLTCTVESKL